MSPDLPAPREVRVALLRERLRARQVEAARARLDGAVEAFNATGYASAVERLHAMHQLNQLRLALAMAEWRPRPHQLGNYKCR